ncbi:hypothetical protein [Candidatus Nitrosocosmicus hydrocola]|nr:hypothetical protein [Candidatus Nitrosocosmicus hydrocola]
MNAVILAFFISSTSMITDGAVELTHESIFLFDLFTNSIMVLSESSDP